VQGVGFREKNAPPKWPEAFLRARLHEHAE
jgi:hypothetical protein